MSSERRCLECEVLLAVPYRDPMPPEYCAECAPAAKARDANQLDELIAAAKRGDHGED